MYSNESIDREKFLRSILRKCGEPDRWLVVLKLDGTPSGFVHAKIDRDERPGWGYVMEFGIVPEQRRRGWGAELFDHVRRLIKDRGASEIWLTTDPSAEAFWHAVGFRQTGQTESGRRVLVAKT